MSHTELPRYLNFLRKQIVITSFLPEFTFNQGAPCIQIPGCGVPSKEIGNAPPKGESSTRHENVNRCYSKVSCIRGKSVSITKVFGRGWKITGAENVFATVLARQVGAACAAYAFIECLRTRGERTKPYGNNNFCHE